MVKPLAIFCAALFSCLAIAPASARAAVSDSTNPQYTVQLLTANGSGCPPGSTAVSSASDQQFTVTYSQYAADAGGGAPPGEFRRNCQLDVLVGVPSGWTFGVVSAQYRGFANLDTGARGTVAADYYIAGQTGGIFQPYTVSGPTTNIYEFDNALGVISWAPCHSTAGLNIDTSLLVSPGTDPTFFNEMTMDSSDVGIATYFHLAFRRC